MDDRILEFRNLEKILISYMKEHKNIDSIWRIVHIVRNDANILHNGEYFMLVELNNTLYIAGVNGYEFADLYNIVDLMKGRENND